MRSSELVFLKLGGSLITEKSKLETPRLDVIERVSLEIARALRDSPNLRLLLGHGSGSYGHYAAKEYGVHRGHLRDWQGYAVTSAAAQRLNRLVVDALLRRGVPVVSVQPSASALCRSGELLEMAVFPARMLLDRGLIPLLYGDVALDEEQGCTIVSTEQVFAHLAQSLRPDRMVIVGEVDGVFTGDPKRDKDASAIPVISSLDVNQVMGLLAGSRDVDVTGGMRSKVMILFKLIEEQPQLIIRLISGMREGAIEAALKGEADGEGTLLRF